MIVVDTSAILKSLAAVDPNPKLDERLASERDLHAPHLVDVEVLHALRSLVRRGQLQPGRAAGVLEDFFLLRLTRYSHTRLIERIWALRENLSAYDAAFVALAEALDATLVTSDRRLARASGHSATVELYI